MGVTIATGVVAGFTLTGNLPVSGTGSGILWNNGGTLGVGPLLTNSTGTILQFGGATASFPMIKRNATALNVRLADDSGNADLTANSITANGNSIVGAQIQFVGASKISSGTDGLVLMTNSAATSFTRIQLGGTTSSFPALAVNGASLRCFLADGSNWARLQTGQTEIRPDTALTAGGSTSMYLQFSSSSQGIYAGSGAPTISAAQGSLYIRSDGSTTATRLYVNTNGTTGWTNFVSAA